MKSRFAKSGRLSLLALLLLASPLQAAVPVLACSVMDIELRGVCCCDNPLPSPCRELEHDRLPVSDRHCDCCEISATPNPAAGAAVLTGDSWSQPPATAPPPESPLLVSLERWIPPFLPPADHQSAATTYLLTARLRL